MKALLPALFAGCLLSYTPAIAQQTTEAEAGPSETAATRRPSEADLSVLRHIRLLFRLQDAAASGDIHAVEGQQQELAEIGRMLRAQPPADAGLLAAPVAGYVLSGGDPAAAESLAAAEGLAPTMRNLLTGAALFMRRKTDEAGKILPDLKTSLLPSGLSGRVLMAQALLSKDKEKHQELLAAAMSAMPGSLIEESALRRSALAYLEDGNMASVWMRLFRYQRRFPKSVFGPPFVDTVFRRIVEKEAGGLHVSDDALDRYMNALPIPDRRNLLLAVARDAAALNLVPRAAFAASRLKRLAVPGSMEEELARLYGSVFAVTGPRARSAADDLRGVDKARLPVPEQYLLEASLATVAEIEKPIGRLESGEPATAEVSPTRDLESKVQALLDESDKVLGQLTQ